MIREIKFNNFSKARFWFNTIPELFRIDRNRQKEFITVNNNHNKIIISKKLMLELYIPFGAKIDYGILGIKTQKNNEKLFFELYKDNSNEKVFSESYIKLIDAAYIGLPNEFYNKIKSTIINLKDYIYDIPTGKVQVCYGAHGVVNSSPNIFKKLIIILLKLAFNNKEYTDEELVKLIIE